MGIVGKNGGTIDNCVIFANKIANVFEITNPAAKTEVRAIRTSQDKKIPRHISASGDSSVIVLQRNLRPYAS